MKAIMRLLSFLIISIILVLPANAAELIKGRVVGVSDGDTITVLQDNKQYKIRLYGIDTPEKKQDFGQKAKQFTSGLVYRQKVTVIPKDKDRYGRTVGIVYINNKCLNEELIINGLAWVYRKYCNDTDCKRWSLQEAIAREKKLGLWIYDDPVPPWEYRKNNRNSSYQLNEIPKTRSVYHGNTRSNVFHQKGCSQFNCKNCRERFTSRSDAIREGYRPCGICKP